MNIDPGLVGTTFVAMLFIVPFLLLLAVLWWREWRERDYPPRPSASSCGGEANWRAERQECETMTIETAGNTVRCVLHFGDAEQIMLDALAAPYVHYGEGPAGLCRVCCNPLETVGDVNDGICPLCALIPPEHRS